MLTKNTNFWLKTMLMNAFLFLKMEAGYTRICASGKIGKFNNFLRFRAPFGKILRVIDSKKVREVH